MLLTHKLMTFEEMTQSNHFVISRKFHSYASHPHHTYSSHLLCSAQFITSVLKFHLLLLFTGFSFKFGSESRNKINYPVGFSLPLPPSLLSAPPPSQFSVRFCYQLTKLSLCIVHAIGKGGRRGGRF